MSLSIRDALLPDGRTASVTVEGNRITEIGPKREADATIDGRGKALLPGFVNTHTHAAMTLLRGYADDMDLKDWLAKRIWPAERKLTPEAVYWGTKLACLEMIKSGTTCFNDMYFHMDRAAQAVEETGLRAVLSEGFIDLGDAARAEKELRATETFLRHLDGRKKDRITGAVGPHAMYTVSEPSLVALRELAEARDRLVHIHVSETKGEVDDARKAHGKPPAQYLAGLGILSPNAVAAHGCWLDDQEVRAVAGAGAAIAHCPISNMKLATGRAMPLTALRAAGVTVSLGTDGAASNNNLDMFQTMKVAALLHKFADHRATTAPAKEVFAMATAGGARALHIDAGLVEVGKLADLILLDLKRPEMTPAHDVISNVVYAADGGCVDTVVCDGRVLMEGRRVPGEAEILREAAAHAAKLLGGT